MSTTPTPLASAPSWQDRAKEELGKTIKRATKDKPKAKSKPAASARPTKILPTERITFTKQLDILRAWAAASGPMSKAVTNNDVAEIVKMQPSTVSLANAFFNNINLLTRTAEGSYVPSQDVMAFLRHYEWNPEAAAQKLAPTLAKTWFADALLSKLAFGPMQEDDCIQNLADTSAAGPDYRSQLRILLEYLAAVGLIQRDGNIVKKGNSSMSATSTAEAPTTKQDAAPEAPKTATPSMFGTTEGQVHFNVAVKVNMAEFANWEPQRIAAFFNGIAQVLAAKADVEKAG